MIAPSRRPWFGGMADVNSALSEKSLIIIKIIRVTATYKY